MISKHHINFTACMRQVVQRKPPGRAGAVGMVMADSADEPQTPRCWVMLPQSEQSAGTSCPR